MHINTSSSNSPNSGSGNSTPHQRARLSRELDRPGPVDCGELVQRLKALTASKGESPPAIPEQELEQAARWMSALLERMETMSTLTVQELTELAAHKNTAGTATKIAVASRGKMGRTSLVAASAMYWLSFAPGKIATNTVAALMIAGGLPQGAAYAPWTNILLVPVIQVLFAEPVGGAYRADGQSYGSPDGVAYVNYQTAHALLVRAWFEGKPADMAKYQKIMGEIVDGVIERENKLDDAGHRRMAIVSGAGKPVRDEHGIATNPATDPAWSVMSKARWRAFLADEVPVHTFTLLNGISGGVSLLWPGTLSATWAKVPDAALHVLMGTVAMVWMFEGQNSLRRDVQAASVAHGSDGDILTLKRAEHELEKKLWEARKVQAKAALVELCSLRESLKALIKRSVPNDPKRAQAQEQLDQLNQTVRELELRLSDIRKAQGRAERATQAWASSRNRAEVAVNRTLSSYVGELDKQPVKWLDGSPVIVRNLSKLMGYMAVLAASAAQAMMLAQMLQTNDPMSGPAGAALANSTLPPGNATEAHASGASVAQFAMASTVALTAIVGWTGRSLYAVPAFEHLLHGVIGVANRIGSTASALCGVARPAPATADLVVEVPGERAERSGSPQRGTTPSSSTSSSSSDA
ncbi:MAG: hypothetical protein DCF26_04530 [Burkholderiales bacterium]|nr:MAG: hypothetical protein DCF26_04530 [Burkholderiales bacterium]